MRSVNTLFLLVLILFLSSTAAWAKNINLQQPDTVSSVTDTVVSKIQNARAALHQINLSNQNEKAIGKIKRGIAEVNNTLTPIRKELEANVKTIAKKNLITYQFILDDAKTKLSGWQETLTANFNALQANEKQVSAISEGDLLKLNVADSNLDNNYNQQLNELKLQLRETSTANGQQRDSLNQVIAAASAAYSTVNYLDSEVKERISKSGKNELSKESPYLWAAPRRSVETSVGALFRTAYEGQNKVLSFFFNSTWDNRILLLLTTVLFFFWIRKNIKQAEGPALKPLMGELNFKYLSPLPFIASLVFMLSLIPIFEPSSPSFYIEISQFILLVIITIKFYKSIDRPAFKLWLAAVFIYITVITVSTIVNEAIFLRSLLIILNVGSLYLGRKFYKKIQDLNFANGVVKFVFTIYMSFNIIAIILNVFGRITLAKIFSNTAVISLTQVITLAIFVKVISEAVQLQMKISASSKGLFSRINLNKTRVTLKKIWSLLAMVLWLLVFTISLNISGGVYSLLTAILTKPRSFGSLSFSLGNVALFILIVYFANVLQKNVGVLFGENRNSIEDQIDHKSSKLALLRLIIIFIGVMFAVVSSGIPMDKLTVAIGALGVGIGLGLQNIVNNFVSGIILIFEKPFRVGDYVELADKKGRVKDIGIRASKMLTPQGSEIIIPNGDLLSGRLVNWTLSNDFLKTEVALKINVDADLAAVYKIIEKEVSKMSGTLSNSPPEILVNGITAASIDLKILVWINNIYIEAEFKSELLKTLMVKFKEAEISII